MAHKNTSHELNICVVGSSNYDLIAYTERLPKVGETILGKKFSMGCGGKGANQAVAAANLGAHVSMVTKLGEDIFGKLTIENFKNFNVNTEFVYFTNEVESGVAPIWVDEKGDNSIIVIPGANNALTEREIDDARKSIANSQMLLCQNEIPFSVTVRALQIAKAHGVLTCFNPAPAPLFDLPQNFYELVDILCLNETESATLAKQDVNTIEDAIAAGKFFIHKGVKTVLVTLGAKGCVLVNANLSTHIPSRKVTALDTAGAGDCFIGSFAYFLMRGCTNAEAVRRAQYVAAQSVQKAGTQSSYPKISELPEDFFL